MSPVRTALIFLSGEHPGARLLGQLLPHADRLIAADGGWDVAQSLGVRPDTIIGDMDSVAGLPAGDGGGEGPGPRIIRHPADKDWSDTELALELAWREGCARTILVGGGGGRLDHLLAIQALFQRPQAPDRWYTLSDEIIRIDGPFSSPMADGTVLSLFPAGPGTCRARSRGLKWPLDSLVWKPGDFGLSNVSTGAGIGIDPVEGRLLLVRPLAAGGPICPLR
jgi:thiamine pyrophosphokinase